MFNRKEYAREYMREWRKTHPPNKGKQSEYDKKKWAKKSLDPEWRDKERARTRKAQRKTRDDLEVRKKHYAAHKAWAQRNKEHLNAKARIRNQRADVKLATKAKFLKTKYGLTYDDYHAKITENDGKCPICFDVLAVKPCVDHNHVTGQVRDVLCNRCNQWVGFVETRRALVAPMLAYLDKWNALEGVIKQTK
jgi:hypothetical protein